MLLLMQHLLHSRDLSKVQIEALLERAEHYLPVVQERRKVNDAEGKVLATLFYEPSTRTRFSFETAMLRLGGDVISNAHMQYTSSIKKGETIRDTGTVISHMADIMVMRHPLEGSVDELASASIVPVINAGDGPADHPTQGLLDIFTIKQELGQLEEFTIAMVGDLRYGRVVHAQCAILNHFKRLRFVMVSPEELRMPKEYVDLLKEDGHQVIETEDLEAAAQADVISDTRIQEERFDSHKEYMKYKGVYIITPEFMSKCKKDAILIHPLPRVDEIELAVDEDSRAKYFKQVEYGVAMRMGIIAELLGL